MNVIHIANVVHESTEVPVGRRARARLQRSDEIVTAAMALVRAEGLEGLTTHGLAARLDVAVGALYRYFPSKHHLLAELQRRALGALGAHLAAELAATEGSFRGRHPSLPRLVVVGRAWGRFARQRATEFALLGQMLSDPRTLVPGDEGAALVGPTLAVVAQVAALFEDAAAEGAMPPGDATERAMLYASGLRATLELAKLRAHVPDFDAHGLADAMARALLQGFGASPEAVGRAVASARRHEERLDRTREEAR